METPNKDKIKEAVDKIVEEFPVLKKWPNPPDQQQWCLVTVTAENKAEGVITQMPCGHKLPCPMHTKTDKESWEDKIQQNRFLVGHQYLIPEDVVRQLLATQRQEIVEEIEKCKTSQYGKGSGDSRFTTGCSWCGAGEARYHDVTCPRMKENLKNEGVDIVLQALKN